MVLSHEDRLQQEIAHLKDELRRERLVLERIISLAEDALIALAQNDLGNARYSLARIVGRRLDDDDG